ncbi:hypothetical protein NL676_031966 [Syzygium grande]|nr:hypothetical protein NL676_031966 [Syzygium grande]
MGALHVSAHLTAVLMLMLLMEFGVEACIRHKLLATSGYHTLYQWHRTVECEHFPDPTGLRVRMERSTFGLYRACIKYLLSALDVLEVPKNWDTDRRSREEQNEPERRSHLRKSPSKWSSKDPSKDPVETEARRKKGKGKLIEEELESSGARPPERDKEPIRDSDDMWPRSENHPETPVSEPAQPEPEPEQSLCSEKEKEEEARRKKGKGKLIEEEPERSDALPPEREKEPIIDSDDERPQGEGEER